MAMLNDLIRLAQSQGLKFDGIRLTDMDGEGLGIVAEKDLDTGHLMLSVPVKTLRTRWTVPENLRLAAEGISVHGLLAYDVLLDKSESCLLWKSSLPAYEMLMTEMPFWWDPVLQDLLPEAAANLTIAQRQKLNSDWKFASTGISLDRYDEFAYYWFMVNTRTFYYTHPDAEGEQDPNDCLALAPIADYFNHADEGCKVKFSPESYTFTTKRKIRKGEEIFVSYGNHSNDFLLAEYGFCLDTNKWDSICLDTILGESFSKAQKQILQSEGYWGDLILDGSSVCYRTEVALRLLCMPIQAWRQSLEDGFDDEDEYQSMADEILLRLLEPYLSLVNKRIQQVSSLDSRYEPQKNVLLKRWEQIFQLVNDACGRLQSPRSRGNSPS